MGALPRDEPHLQGFPTDDHAPAQPDNGWSGALLQKCLEVPEGDTSRIGGLSNCEEIASSTTYRHAQTEPLLGRSRVLRISHERQCNRLCLKPHRAELSCAPMSTGLFT